MMQPLKPMLAFDPSMAHEVVEGETMREYLGRLLAPIPTDGSWAMEPKLDGVRWQVLVEDAYDQVGTDVIQLARVRSIGGRNLKEHKTPEHLAQVLKELPGGTILDGELIAGDASSDVGSLEQRGKQRYVVFDVLAFDGKDVTRHPWEERRRLLVGIAEKYEFDDVVSITPVAPVDLDVLEQWCVYGCEGAVCKRKDARYSSGGRPRSGFVKIKPKQTTDAIVRGWEWGEGKSNRDRCGALKVELVETGKMTTVGYDADPQKANAMAFANVRIELQHYGWQKSGLVRHPGYVRRRDDLDGVAHTEANSQIELDELMDS
jgi:ATP-dependent DNA ligase